MPTPPFKLLWFIPAGEDESVVIYADTIVKYEPESKKKTTITCNFAGVLEEFTIKITIDELLDKIHGNDEFEIIKIGDLGDDYDDDEKEEDESEEKNFSDG
jgi:hypothetical protein